MVMKDVDLSSSAFVAAGSPKESEGGETVTERCHKSPLFLNLHSVVLVGKTALYCDCIYI